MWLFKILIDYKGCLWRDIYVAYTCFITLSEKDTNCSSFPDKEIIFFSEIGEIITTVVNSNREWYFTVI